MRGSRAFLFATSLLQTVLSTASTTTEEPITDCPSQVPGGETCLPPGPPKYYPDPDECSNYWLCVGGCASNGKCQEDYLYDNEHGWCNHPEDVDCGDRPCQDTDHCPETTTSTCISQIPSGQHCPGATVNLPDVDDCSKYWHCEGGCATNQQCELNFLFDMASKKCKEAAQTDCSVLHRPCMDPQHCPCVNYVAHDDYFCQEEDFEEYFPDMNDCARYLNCSGGCFTSTLCPENYLYDTEYLWCDYPHEITCGERPCPHPDRCGTQPHPTTTTSTTSTPHSPASSTDPATTTPSNTDTTACLIQIPSGQHCPWSTVNLPDIYDCSKYWHCEGGCATNQQCELNFLFDMASKKCKEAAQTDCSVLHRPCMDPQHCPCVDYVAHDDYFCQEEDFEEIFPDMNDCARYLNCTGGCFSSGLCTENYLFDTEYLWCSYPYEITCGERPCPHPDRCGTHPSTTTSTPTTPHSSTDPASSTSTTPATTTEDCEHAHDGYFCQEEDFEEFFPDMNDCARFLNCSGGCFSSVLCQENYLYDTEKLWCSYPHEVTCGERPCPHPDRCGTQPHPTTTTSTTTTTHSPTDLASSTDPALSTSTTPATTTEDCGHTEFCQDHLSMGIYADPYNCRKYWSCTNNGAGDHHTCEGEQLFDLNYMGCNYPYLVDCQDRPICDDCDENCEYKTTTPPQEDCEVHHCTADGFFCETKCANTYCRCFGGNGFLSYCPEGQLWDCEEETCNYQCLVDDGACCPDE